MLRMSSITLTYSCCSISKTPDSFGKWTCGKLPHVFSSATFNSRPSWVLDEGFKIVSCVACQTWWSLFLFSHLQTLLILALMRDMQCVQSPMHLVESAAPSVALFNELCKQKLINSFIYCLQQNYH